MTGFTFRNRHSSEFGIGARSIERNMIPSLRKNEFVIPGRHGTLDYGNNTYEKRMMRLEIGIIKSVAFENFRKHVRELAFWLSGKGALIFDDERNALYNASVYDAIGIENLMLNPIAKIEVLFECQPFAESLEYNQVNIPSITNIPHKIPVSVDGTSESCCIITIKNNGTTTIDSLSLTRKVSL